MRAVDLRTALRQLSRQRLRSGLALLGIFLGTGSFVLLVGLLRGGQAALQYAAQEASEGDLVVVRKDDAPLRQQHRPTRDLSRRDGATLAGAQPLNDAFVSAEQRQSTWAQRGDKRKRVTVTSANLETPALYRLKLAQGRYFDQQDIDQVQHVCVVGHEVWTELFGTSGLGERLVIDQAPCVVIGVLENKPLIGSTSDTDIWNRKVLLTEPLFDTSYNPRRNADKLIVRPRRRSEATVIDPLRALTRSLLLRLHDGVENFRLTPRHDGHQEEQIATILYVLLLGAVFVSLTVGGINVMNVLLVSVTERTREIGIRRALGASPNVIRWQFLTEAMVLTGAGGLLGVLGGASACALAAWILRRLVGAWELGIAPWSMLAAFGVSVLIGLVFGTYPAARAARLLITDALRRE
jgi:putative ABC transport system permease protein